MAPCLSPPPKILPPQLPLTSIRLSLRRVVTITSSLRDHRKSPPDRNLLRAKDALFLPSHAISPLLCETLDPSSLLPDQALGLVASAQANFMRVVVLAGGPHAGEELLCVVRAVAKKLGRRVLVGDRVLVGSVDWAGRRGMIEEAFGRETEVFDPPVANVDHLLVLFSFEQPRLEAFALTRFLIEAASTGIQATLAINKMELVPMETISSWEERLQSWGYQPIFCSVEKSYGLASLIDLLKGRTTVIVGPSGVGKSSLINAVRGDLHNFGDAEVHSLLDHAEGNKWSEHQPVGTVSKRSGRGKHTTRNVTLLPIAGGGYLADTPGFSQPTLTKVTTKSLAETFPEIRQMLSTADPFRCSFSDCLHLGEPGCLVTGDWERYVYYIQLLDEIKIREELELRTRGTKRESDVRWRPSVNTLSTAVCFGCRLQRQGDRLPGEWNMDPFPFGLGFLISDSMKS